MRNGTPGEAAAPRGLHWRRNLIHASATVEEAEREIALWFADAELVEWSPVLEPYIHEVRALGGIVRAFSVRLWVFADVLS